MILGAYAVPHPPIILPEVGRGEEEKISATRSSMERMAREIADLKPDTIVISSPHAPYFADGFFIAGGDQVQGDFRSFGVMEVREEAVLDREFTQAFHSGLAKAGILSSVVPAGRRGMDHGALIPLRFIHQEYRDFKLVLTGLSLLAEETHRQAGRILSDLSDSLGRRLIYIASGDLSHVLKKDGPYGFKEEGPRFDAEIARIFETGDLEALFGFAPEFLGEAAECGLRAFQIMAGVLDGRPFTPELYSYEGTFGVGYAVASFLPMEV